MLFQQLVESLNYYQMQFYKEKLFLCKMIWRVPITALAISISFFFTSVKYIAEPTKAHDYRILANEEIGLNLNSVEKLITEGDKYLLNGNYTVARKNYDKARDMSKLLLGFYNDLSTSFKGVDALIPREMDINSRQALSLLTKSNLRLVAVFRKINKTELAVPLLVEVVRISSPSNTDGQKAYKLLFELGFVDTPYVGNK